MQDGGSLYGGRNALVLLGFEGFGHGLMNVQSLTSSLLSDKQQDSAISDEGRLLGEEG